MRRDGLNGWHGAYTIHSSSKVARLRLSHHIKVRLWDMRERKELAAAQLPAPVRCIHCSPDFTLIAFGHTSGLVSVYKASELLQSPASLAAAIAIKAAKDEAQLAEAASMFWRTDPGTITTGNLFASSSSAAQTAGSKARSSASAATASQLLSIKGCVYAGVHRRETITDVKFSPCARCVS